MARLEGALCLALAKEARAARDRSHAAARLAEQAAIRWAYETDRENRREGKPWLALEDQVRAAYDKTA